MRAAQALWHAKQGSYLLLPCEPVVNAPRGRIGIRRGRRSSTSTHVDRACGTATATTSGEAFRRPKLGGPMRAISVAIVLAATPGALGFASLPECTPPEPEPLLCESKQANAQSPRDVSPGAPGDDNPAFGYNLVGAHADSSMRLSNIHWHLGAEHYCAGEYDQDYDEGAHRAAAAGRRQPNVNEEQESIAPGRMCSVDRLGLTEAQLEPYNFQYCGGVVRVGSTYEMHYVHSRHWLPPLRAWRGRQHLETGHATQRKAGCARRAVGVASSRRSTDCP